MKTSWNFNLFYTPPIEPKVKRDVARAKRLILSFEKKYKRRKDYLKKSSALLHALRDYEALMGDASAARALLYYHFRKDSDAKDAEARARLTQLSEEFTRYENRLLFFTLSLGKLDKKTQNRFLKHPLLSHYRYFLERLFRQSRYDLTEPEEKILNLKSLTSYGLWVDGVDKLIAKQTVPFKGKRLPIAEASGKIARLPAKTRRMLNTAIMERYREISDFAESELNAVVLHKKVNDELRGFEYPYSSTILGYENEEKSVRNLVQAVTETYAIAHRFYELKAQLLGLKRLTYADRSAEVGHVRAKVSFPKAVDLYRSMLEPLDKDYLRIFETFLKRGQIDVHPREGKTGGAYCASDIGVPTMVLLNHTDDMRSYMTLAHEMGHAIHAEMSKSQSPIYQGHTISVAETASTLFEQLSFEALLETLSHQEKIVALHDKINDDVSSVFRQIAFFNFECDLHKRIRAEGFLPKEEIAKLFNTHMQNYLGPHFDLEELDGYFFVAVSHFRRFFYVYSYAYGQLISRAMVERYRKDRSYTKQIRGFLSAGGSKSPETMFQDIGINTTRPSFFNKALQGIASDVKRLESLVRRRR